MLPCGPRPCTRVRGHLRRRHAVPVLVPALGVISIASSSLPSSTTTNGEESWRRSALTTHHLCPSVGERNHHHGAIDLPAVCSEFRRQLLREKRIEWRLDASCSGRWGGLSSSVRSASSPCVRKREGGEKALQREPQLGGDLELRQLRRGCVGA
jgi:hypothetical protein